MSQPRVLTTALAIGESPRWHQNRLWLSDMGAGEVVAVDLDGGREVVAAVPGMPMGLGWLPEGELLIVSARDGRLLSRAADGSITTYADLSSLGGYPWSDMVVDGRGYAYLGNIGFEFGVEPAGTGFLAVVTPDRSVRQIADDIAFPNGLAIAPDNATLIVAESYGNRLSAFDLGPDGALTNRRVWAQLGDGAYPDGICLDADGAVWYADVPNQRCVRVGEGGRVLQTVEVDRGCFACALGGADRRTLFITAAQWSGPQGMRSHQRTGQVLTIEAPAPGAGWP
ncbi:MAG TPA: SMP-30/gluconolactonase/LRE family protein [Micromonosporaceae bacterium]